MTVLLRLAKSTLLLTFSGKERINIEWQIHCYTSFIWESTYALYVVTLDIVIDTIHVYEEQ